MRWLKVSQLAETSGLGPHQMLRRLKALNRRVNGRLLRREGEKGNWQVSESVLVEIREAERARAEIEGDETIGLKGLQDRINELEVGLASLREAYRDNRRQTNSTLRKLDSRASRIERSLSAQTSFTWLEESPEPLRSTA